MFEYRAVTDFEEMVDVGLVAARPRFGKTHITQTARRLDQFLSGDFGIGRPMADVVVGQKRLEGLLVDDLSAEEIDLRLVDDLQRGSRFDASHGKFSRVLFFRRSPPRELHHTDFPSKAERQYSAGTLPSHRQTELGADRAPDLLCVAEGRQGLSPRRSHAGITNIDRVASQRLELASQSPERG